MAEIILRGGNSGFFIGNQITTASDSSCPRRILLRSKGVEPGLSEGSTDTFAIGHRHEELMAPYLPTARREELVTREIMPGVLLQGHMDFIDDDYVYELKSITSPYTHKSVFGEKGAPKPANLAQLLTYMWASDRVQGKLIYSSWVEKVSVDKTKEVVARVIAAGIPEWRHQRTFLVEIRQEGKIYIDGVDCGLNISAVVRFWKLNAHLALRNQVYAEMPEGACTFCPLVSVCKNFDVFKSTTQAFVNSSESVFVGNKAHAKSP